MTPLPVRRPARTLLLALALVLAVGLVLVPRGDGSQATTPPVAAGAATKDGRPNIVTVMLDDVDLAAIKYMPTVQKLRKQGVTFNRHLSLIHI